VNAMTVAARIDTAASIQMVWTSDSMTSGERVQTVALAVPPRLPLGRTY